MSGIYVHIPFCKSRCIYCGFYSTTQLARSGEYVDAVCRELAQADWKYKDVSTIYFGGGTPSQLPVASIGKILDAIYKRCDVAEDVEITVEGNPDDMTPEFFAELRGLGVNRLSMGVQSFDDSRLAFLRRRHSSAQALRAVADAKAAGFGNISIDLMFGFPNQTLDEWKRDVDKALTLDVQHLSAYSLMYEEGTALCKMLEDGKISEVTDEASLSMYEYLMDALWSAGFEHYEISNFAKPGYRSRHNSSYWQGIPYLGLGAGAHSYDGGRRWYNPDSLAEYIEGVGNDVDVREYETLTDSERYDEYVMTGLRTCDGVDLDALRTLFGDASYEYCMRNAKPHLDAGRMIVEGSRMRLTRSGLFVSNDVMSDLMNTEGV
ncbi:MAG: radical SAM family heme chaperone HemW [Bacteroidaceae bacterium]|nr:radical SAM family heme chaperone HemW [Bacteroidaceae bacterium]